MEKLVCSICGYTSEQKKFRYSDINKHFDNAEAIWCPTNKCKELNKDKRIVPKGYICNCWYEYNGWSTLERQSKIMDIETARSIQRAKSILERGLSALK